MPTIETERLVLRPFTLEDVEAYHALNAPELVKFAMEEPTKSVEEAQERLSSRMLRDYARRGYGRHACVDKASGRVVGFSGFKHLEDFGHDGLGIHTRCFPGPSMRQVWGFRKSWGQWWRAIQPASACWPSSASHTAKPWTMKGPPSLCMS